jgi:hypothetical protein
MRVGANQNSRIELRWAYAGLSDRLPPRVCSVSLANTALPGQVTGEDRSIRWISMDAIHASTILEVFTDLTDPGSKPLSQESIAPPLRPARSSAVLAGAAGDREPAFWSGLN